MRSRPRGTACRTSDEPSVSPTWTSPSPSGARFDATCVAVVRVPGYALSRLRMGQFLPTGALWTFEIQLVDPAVAAAQALRMAYQALAGTPLMST